MLKNRLVIFGLFYCTLIAFSVIPVSADISPTELTATLWPGESIDEFKTVTIPPGPAPKGDVMFAFDLTGSMSPEISAAKTQAIGIMNAITPAIITDAQFGVISFMDYVGYYSSCDYSDSYGSATYGDYPYLLNLDLTADITLVDTTITGLTLGGGADWPQDYTRIIYESYSDLNIHWRPDAIKFLILFGDNPTHDCDFYSVSYGADPGRDTVMFTADDLDFEPTVAGAASAGIKIIAMDSSDRMGGTLGSNAELSFRYMATETGGLWVNSYGLAPPYTGIIQMIEEAIEEVVATIDLLQLSVDPVEFESWVSVDPPFYANVERPTESAVTREFTVTITVPLDTPCGTYEFDIWVNGDGADYGRQHVTITVPCEGIPLFSNVIAILPLATIFAVLIVRRKRLNGK